MSVESQRDGAAAGGTGTAKRVATLAWSPGQIAVASLIGTPLAGCYMYSENERHWGAETAGKRAMAWGLISVPVLFVITLLAPSGMSFLLIVAAAGAIGATAKTSQGQRFAAHLVEGGERQTHWMMIGIAFASLVSVRIAIIAMAVIVGLIAPEWL